MIKGDNVHSPYMDEEAPNAEGKAVSIIKTREIYCGKPTAGYQVVRVGLDVNFTPDLDTVHTLIDEYYTGQRAGSNREEDD